MFLRKKKKPSPPTSPNEELKQKVEVLQKKVEANENDNTYTRLKLDSFIDSDLTTEQVNDLLDKQNDNINI